MILEKPKNPESCIELVALLNDFATGSANMTFEYSVQTTHPQPATTKVKRLKLKRFDYCGLAKMTPGLDDGGFVDTIDGVLIYAVVEDDNDGGNPGVGTNGKRALKLVDLNYWESVAVDADNGMVVFVSRDEVTDTLVSKTFRSPDYNAKRREGSLVFTLDCDENKRELLRELDAFVEDKDFGSPFVMLNRKNGVSDSLVGHRFNGFYFRKWNELGETFPSDSTGEWSLWGRVGDKGVDVCIFKESEIEGSVNIDSLKRELSFKRNAKDGIENVVVLKRIVR